MTLFDICIRRPVLATVISLLIVLVGLVALDRLTVREYPNIDEPVVSVRTDFPGASAEVVEAQVAQILEESLAGIEGIETMVSSSRSERSNIDITFRTSVDPDAAAADVRDRVSRVRGRLPDTIDEPVVSKVEADARPILWMAFVSDRHSTLEISDTVDRVAKSRLQNVSGVAEARIFGERRYSMRIWIDRWRLAAYGLTVQDVETALRRQNVEIPGGRIESLDREFTVLSRTSLITPAQFEAIIVKDAGDYPVRLGQVARAELGPQDNRRIATFNGQTAIGVGIIKQAVANPVTVSEGVRAELPRIIADLPEGMSAEITFDSSIFIERSIAAVAKTIAEAVIFVVLVLFLFLRSVRATIVPLVTIPVSLIGTAALMLAFGFTINTLTLLAMVLAVGLVVDDAIVVLENIHRRIEAGMKPMAAAIEGTREIALPVIAMTLTLVAVFAPIAFTTGRTGRLFVEFALALAGATVISGFVALTLSPMMCSRLLRHETRHGRVYRGLEAGLDGLTRGYRWALSLALRRWPVIVVIAATVAGGNVWLFGSLKQELSPIEDRGAIIVNGSAPEGATLDFTARYSKMFEDILVKVPEVEKYFIVTGFSQVTSALSFVALKPWEARERSQQEIVASLRGQFARIPGILAFPTNQASLGQNNRAKPISFVIMANASYEALGAATDAFVREAQGIPGLQNVESDLNLNKPQLEVSLRRDKVADVGADVDTIGRTLETLLGGRTASRFTMGGKQYDVIVQVEDADRRTPEALNDIFVRGNAGQMVQLSNLVDIREAVAPKELNRFNQSRAVTISATLAPELALGDALNALDRLAETMLPAGFRTDYAGISREFKSSGQSLALVFLLALVFIYLVLAAQFESFRDPLTILLTVPLSIAGALAALVVTGGTLNVYSQIGLITLIGLITKHGILIVAFANQLQDEGKGLVDATLEAAVLRLRPVLMTTAATVLGAVPLAIATGAGAESRQQIGWVIVGGMTAGTVLTLFVVPVAYMLLARIGGTRARLQPAPTIAQPAE